MSDEEQTPRQTLRTAILDRARLEYWALVAEVVSAVAVVVSLVFVGIQLRDGNVVSTRAEANATQDQWTAFNASIYGDGETADIYHAATTGARPLEPVEQVRFAFLLREQGWLTYQGWERVRVGLRPRESFYEGAGVDLAIVICTPGGRVAWPQVRREFPPAYAADIDRLVAAEARTRGAACPSTAPAS
jgi:hypothetical protein